MRTCVLLVTVTESCHTYECVSVCLDVTHMSSWVLLFTVHVSVSLCECLSWCHTHEFVSCFSYLCMSLFLCVHEPLRHMGCLRLVDSLKLQVSFGKEPYKRDDILQKRPTILRSLLIVATPYHTYKRNQCFARHTIHVTHMNAWVLVLMSHRWVRECYSHRWVREYSPCHVSACLDVTQMSSWVLLFSQVTPRVWREYTCVPVCCGVLQCVAVCHTWSHASCEAWVHVRCSVLQCVAVCCSVLQRVAATLNKGAETRWPSCGLVCCSVLQYVAVCCSVLQCVAVFCSVLQCVIVCCSVLACLCLCAFVCLRVAVSVRQCVNAFLRLCLCVFLSVRLCVSVSLCLCVSMCLSLCVSASMYLCVYVAQDIHTPLLFSLTIFANKNCILFLCAYHSRSIGVENPSPRRLLGRSVCVSLNKGCTRSTPRKIFLSSIHT